VTANSTPVEVSTTVYGTCCGGVGLSTRQRIEKWRK
jgi:hypothetical protein